MVYFLVLVSVVAMSGAQLLLKKGLLQVEGYPHNLTEVGSFFVKAYTNDGYVISAVILTIVTAFAWIVAVSEAALSQVYPFMALSCVLVAVFSMVIFKEDVSPPRWAGIGVICLGVVLVSRG